MKNIEFNNLSNSDSFGRVFSKEGKVFRVIYDEHIEDALELLNSGLVKELVEKKLFPKTTISNINIKNYKLILEHENIPVSYAYEWSPSMLKDAALLTIKVNDIASKYGYNLKDAHSYNVLFKGVNPVYIDIGSFVKKDSSKSFKNELIKSFVIPLILFKEGDFYLAYKLLLDPSNPYCKLLVGELSPYLKSKIKKFYVIEITFLKIFKFKINNIIPEFVARKISTRICKLSHIPIDKLKEKIQKINFNKKPTTKWENYQADYFQDKKLDSNYRFNKILQSTNDLKDINTILDVAGNNGYFPYLLSKNKQKRYDKITSIDYDINSVENAYCQFKNEHMEINLLAQNITQAIINQDLISRLKSDAVYVLALSHHLLLTQNLKIHILLEMFSNLSNKYIFIEFMPLGLYSQNDKSPKTPSWYNIKWFRKEFLSFFTIIEEIKLGENRILFVGKKLQ